MVWLVFNILPAKLWLPQNRACKLSLWWGGLTLQCEFHVLIMRAETEPSPGGMDPAQTCGQGSTALSASRKWARFSDAQRGDLLKIHHPRSVCTQPCRPAKQCYLSSPCGAELTVWGSKAIASSPFTWHVYENVTFVHQCIKHRISYDQADSLCNLFSWWQPCRVEILRSILQMRGSVWLRELERCSEQNVKCSWDGNASLVPCPRIPTHYALLPACS